MFDARYSRNPPLDPVATVAPSATPHFNSYVGKRAQAAYPLNYPIERTTAANNTQPPGEHTAFLLHSTPLITSWSDATPEYQVVSSSAFEQYLDTHQYAPIVTESTRQFLFETQNHPTYNWSSLPYHDLQTHPAGYAAYPFIDPKERAAFTQY